MKRAKLYRDRLTQLAGRVDWSVSGAEKDL